MRRRSIRRNVAGVGRPGSGDLPGRVALTSGTSTSRLSLIRVWRDLRVAGIRAARDPFRVTLFIMIILAVSRIHEQFKALDALRPALVLTVLAAVIAYAKPALLSNRPYLETWPAKLMAGFGVVACLSAPFGISFGSSAEFILTVYAKTLVLAFLVIAAMRTPRDYYGLVWTVVVSTALLCWTSLFVFKVQHYAGYDRLAGLATYDANDLGLVLLVGLAFTLLAFQTAGKWGKVFSGIVLVGIGAAISKSGSRGAFLGLMASGIAVLLFLDSMSLVKRVAVVLVTGAALSVFSPPGYWRQMRTLLSPEADYNWDSPTGRRQVTLRGIGYFEEYPWFGLGINNFERAECTISTRALQSNGGPLRCTPPHNAYLEAGAETGVGGIVLWMLMIPGGAVSLLLLRRRVPREWAHGNAEQRLLYISPGYLAIGFVGFAVGSFFLSFAWVDVTYILVAAWAALQVAIRSMMLADQRALAPAVQPAPVSRYRPSVVRPVSARNPAWRMSW
jgi:O-antigen ligase